MRQLDFQSRCHPQTGIAATMFESTLRCAPSHGGKIPGCLDLCSQGHVQENHRRHHGSPEMLAALQYMAIIPGVLENELAS